MYNPYDLPRSWFDSQKKNRVIVFQSCFSTNEESADVLYALNEVTYMPCYLDASILLTPAGVRPRTTELHSSSERKAGSIPRGSAELGSPARPFSPSTQEALTCSPSSNNCAPAGIVI